MKKLTTLRLKVIITLLMAMILNACTSTSYTHRFIHEPLDVKYRGLADPPNKNERLIDEITLDLRKGSYYDEFGIIRIEQDEDILSLFDNTEFASYSSSGDYNMIRYKLYFDEQISGIPWQKKEQEAPVVIQNVAGPFLDKLVEGANRIYPYSSILLRNTRYDIGYVNERKTYEYSADIVTTEPMPQPVIYTADIRISESAAGQIVSVDGSVIGQISIASISRADLYRRTHNYLTDTNHKTKTANADFQTITFETESMDLGRIRGTYTFFVDKCGKIGTKYRISSTFTIDFHDARAQIRFDEAKLRNGKPIFLQSIADAAKQELKRFTDNLISSITS